MRIFIIIISVICAGCGSATLGPLVKDGLDARKALRADVDVLRMHGSASNLPLDALIDVENGYAGTQSDQVFESRITVRIVNAEGLVPTPNVLINGQQLVSDSRGSCSITIPNMDTMMTVQITWPDTVIALTHPLFSAPSLGADVISSKLVWSKKTRLPIDTRGVHSDSIVCDFSQLTDSMYFDYLMTVTMPDTGSIDIPSIIADSTKDKDLVLIFQKRSYYTTHVLNTPRSGYGNRVVGVLQRCRTAYGVQVVP